MKAHFWVPVLVALGMALASCAPAVRIPDQEPGVRASFNAAALAPQYSSAQEENSPEIRATIHEAIKKHLLQIGRYPKRAIEQSELLRLTSMLPNSMTGDSKWSYEAVIRINTKTTSLDSRFIVFERDDALVVRKVSV